MNERSRAPRYSLEGIQLYVEGTPVRLLNISSSGFLFEAGGGRDFTVGAPVNAVFEFTVLNQHSALKATGAVVRCSAESIAVNYKTASVSWPKLLQLMEAKERARRHSA